MRYLIATVIVIGGILFFYLVGALLFRGCVRALIEEVL